MTRQDHIIKGEAKHWEPGQSYLADRRAEIPRRLHLHADRRQRDPDGPHRLGPRHEISGGRAAQIQRDHRADLRRRRSTRRASRADVRHPSRGATRASASAPRRRLLLRRAGAIRQSIAAMPDQKLGDRSLPAVVDQGRRQHNFIVLFDRTTKLPAAVRTRDDDNISGDSNYDMILSRLEGGRRRASARTPFVPAQRHRSRSG